MDTREPALVDIAQPPMLSIVTTLYRSRQFIERFYTEARRVADALGLSFEIVLVNDGSPDDSLDVARAIHERDRRTKVVDLSRNFGHHRALMTAFYQHLKAGMSQAMALRIAQSETRFKYPHPYYWAGFVLTGHPGNHATEGGI